MSDDIFAEGFEFPSDVVDLDSIDDNPNFLVYSYPGTGKTTWATSDDAIMVINCEAKGVISARHSKILGKHVKQWKAPTWTKFVEAIEWLQEVVRSGKKIPFKWVVVDTVTTLQGQQLMRHILDEVHAKKSSRDLFIPDRPEYLRNQRMLVDYIKQLNDLPVGVVYLAHTMEVEREGQKYLLPAIQGGLDRGAVVAQEILAMMTSFGYMYTEQKRNAKGQKLIDATTKQPLLQRVIQWESYGKSEGKDRTGVLGHETRDVTLKQIRLRMEAADKEIQEKESANAND